MKYGRPVNYSDGIRMMDVISTPEPLPSWAADAEAFLSKMYETQKQGWVDAQQWFVLVLDGVQPCASHTGEDYSDPASYLNPDGSDGNGVLPEVPEDDSEELLHHPV